MQKKFEEIRKQAESTEAPKGVYQYTMAAHENAEETIFVEKSASEDEYESIAMQSLESILCFSNDTEAQEYFRSIGVNF